MYFQQTTIDIGIKEIRKQKKKEKRKKKKEEKKTVSEDGNGVTPWQPLLE